MLVTLSEMKTFLGITGSVHDDFLTQEINAVTSAANGYCGRVLNQATYTQRYFEQFYPNSYDRKVLWTYHYPIISITSIEKITKDNDGNETAVAYASTERLTEDKIGRIYLTQKNGEFLRWFEDFSGSGKEIRIQYSAGYQTIPEDIKKAVYSIVQESYNQKVSELPLGFGNNVQRLSVPGVGSIDFDYTLQANERKIAWGMILGNWVNVFDSYRSERVLTGAIKENNFV